MLKNYFLIAMRVILGNKIYSLISVGGLAIGLSACMLVMLFVVNELSYDRWIKGGEHVYKVESTYSPKNTSPLATTKTAYPVMAAVKKKFPQVTHGVQILDWTSKVRRDDLIFNDRVTYATSEFFDIFDMPLVSGDRTKAVTDNTSILVSKSTAVKYFGTQNPVGQVLTVEAFGDVIDYNVVGVLEDTPKNSHFKIHMLALFDPNRNAFKPMLTEWYASPVHTYIRLNPNANADQINQQIHGMASEYIKAEYLANEENLEFNILPMFDIHLYSDKERQRETNGSISVVVSYILAAALILFIACINFVNLSTARATMRAKEVGLRKVMGATREQVAAQFVSESIFFTFTAYFVGLIITILTLSWFNTLLEKSLSISAMFEPMVILFNFVLLLVVGALAGAYPAFVLSSFRPAQTLRSNKSSGSGSSVVRNLLVVVQFGVAVTLMVATTIGYYQTEYINNLDKGFDNTNRLTLSVGKDPNHTADTMKQEFLNIPGVEAAGLSSQRLPRSGSATVNVKLLNQSDSGRLVTEAMQIGYGFFDTFGVKPLAGQIFGVGEQANMYRSYEEEGVRSTGDVVVNELLLKKFGFNDPQEAIGQQISTENADVTIVGVVPNLYVRSLKYPVRPMVFFLFDEERLGVLTLKLKPENQARTLMEVDQVWRKMLPEKPVDRSFVESDFDALYHTEAQQISVLTVFTLVALFIATIGIYGLASFTIQRRYKEVSIRKVHGASSTDIIVLMMWQFSKPVMLGCVIGLAGAYWLTSAWLETFINRIGISDHVFVFVTATIASILVAWLTTYFQVNKVANSSPSIALREE